MALSLQVYKGRNQHLHPNPLHKQHGTISNNPKTKNPIEKGKTEKPHNKTEMDSIQTSAQLLNELTRHQQAYKTLSKRIETKIARHQEDARGVRYTAEQIAYRAEMLRHVLEPMYGELHDLGAKVEKMGRDVRDLEGAEALLSLRG